MSPRCQRVHTVVRATTAEVVDTTAGVVLGTDGVVDGDAGVVVIGFVCIRQLLLPLR